jgi:ABC-type phosphate/phosphonate transport system permease subunit
MRTALRKTAEGPDGYTDVALILLWYLILVIAVDLLSAWLRHLARLG